MLNTISLLTLTYLIMGMIFSRLLEEVKNIERFDVEYELVEELKTYGNE